MIEVELDLVDFPHGSVVDAFSLIDDRDELDRALGWLEPEQRAVIVLHYVLGMSLADAAASLGVPTGTFKSRLSRAIGALRAALEAQARASALEPTGRRTP